MELPFIERKNKRRNRFGDKELSFEHVGFENLWDIQKKMWNRQLDSLCIYVI